MAASIRKNLTFLIFKHTSSKNGHVCLSLLPHFFSTHTNPTVYNILVHNHDFPCEFASRVASELGRVKNPEKVDTMLSFLKSSGFSNVELQKIIKYSPRILCYSLQRTIMPKIKSFQDTGFSSADITKIISINPTILNLSLNNNIIPSLSVLKDLLGSNAAVVKVMRKTPRILNFNVKRTLVPNVEFLRSCGVSMDRIRIILQFGSPVAFACKPDAIRASLEKAQVMGLRVSSKLFIYAIQTIASTSNDGWELKLQAFRNMGFSDSNISSMFRKEPRVLGVSNEKMKKITEGLVATGKFHISSIVDQPKSLAYSFEKRYKPRIRILGLLESKNLIENWPTLRTLGHSSDAQFFKVYISPYLDHFSDVYIPKVEMKP